MALDHRCTVLPTLVLTLVTAGASAEPQSLPDQPRSSMAALLGRCHAIEEACTRALDDCNRSGALACYPAALRCPAWREEADALADALDAALTAASRTGAEPPEDARICLALARVQQPGPASSRLAHASAALTRRAPRDWTPDDWFHSARLAARLLPSATPAEMESLLDHMAHAVREGCEAGRITGGAPSKQCEGLVVELGVDALWLVPSVPAVLPPRVEAELMAALGEASPDGSDVEPTQPTATASPTSAERVEPRAIGAPAIRRELVESGGWAQMAVRRRVGERLSRLTHLDSSSGERCAIAAELMQIADALDRVEPTDWMAALARLGDALRYGSEALSRDGETTACPTPATFASALWRPLEGAAEALANPSSSPTGGRARGLFLGSVEQAALRLIDTYWLAPPRQPGAHWEAAERLARRMLRWPTPAPYMAMLFYGRRLAERGEATAAIDALQVALARARTLGVDCAGSTPGDTRVDDLRSVLGDVRRAVSGPNGTLSKRWSWLARCDGVSRDPEEVDPKPPKEPVGKPEVSKPPPRPPPRPLTSDTCTMAQASRLKGLTVSGVRWAQLGGPRCGEDHARVSPKEAQRRCRDAGGRPPSMAEMAMLREQGATWFWVLDSGRWLCNGTDEGVEQQLACETWCAPARRDRR